MKKFAICSLATKIRGFWDSASHQRLPIGTGYLAGWHSFRILSALCLSAHFNILAELEFAGHDTIPRSSNLVVISVGWTQEPSCLLPLLRPPAFRIVLHFHTSSRFFESFWVAGLGTSNIEIKKNLVKVGYLSVSLFIV